MSQQLGHLIYAHQTNINCLDKMYIKSRNEFMLEKFLSTLTNDIELERLRKGFSCEQGSTANWHFHIPALQVQSKTIFAATWKHCEKTRVLFRSYQFIYDALAISSSFF